MTMDAPPPADDLDEQEALAQESYPQEANYQASQEQDSSTFHSKEPSGFGFVALVAGLISLAAFGGIVIYSLLLSPSAPRQPILIEAEGATKSVPSGAQVKPEPNSDVGVFRMLRGAERVTEKGDAKSQTSTPRRSISLKRAPAPRQPTSTSAESITSSVVEQGEAQKKISTEELPTTAKTSTESDAGVVDRETSAKVVPNAEQNSESVTKEEVVQGSWYVQVAALESQSAADRAWARLHDRLPEILYTQNYIAKEARLASGKRVWRLLLGPQGEADAATLCRALQARSQSCIVKQLTE